MAQYRIEHRYPYYNGCIPIDIWVDIKGFDTPERAKELLEILNGC